MSNTPNQDPYSNPDSMQSYGTTPSQPQYSGQPQGQPVPSQYSGQPQGQPVPPQYSGQLQGQPVPPQYSGQLQGQPVPPQYSGQLQGQPVPPQDQSGQYGYNAPPPNYQENIQAPITGYGNQQAYGSSYPQNAAMSPGGYGYAPPVANSPLPLGEAIRQLPRQYIRVLTKPSAAVFAEEQGKAAWNIVWVQLLALGVITTIFGVLLVNVLLSVLLNNPNISVSTVNSFRGIFSSSFFGSIITVPLGFFIGTGIYHLIAKAFGGTGVYLRYAYSYLLYYTPIAIVSLLVGLVPFIGGLASFALSIYAIVLQVFMTMGVHRLSGGKATFAVLLLPIIAIVLSIILVFVFIAIIASSLRTR